MWRADPASRPPARRLPPTAAGSLEHNARPADRLSVVSAGQQEPAIRLEQCRRCCCCDEPTNERNWFVGDWCVVDYDRRARTLAGCHRDVLVENVTHGTQRADVRQMRTRDDNWVNFFVDVRLARPSSPVSSSNIFTHTPCSSWYYRLIRSNQDSAMWTNTRIHKNFVDTCIYWCASSLYVPLIREQHVNIRRTARTLKWSAECSQALQINQTISLKT